MWGFRLVFTVFLTSGLQFFSWTVVASYKYILLCPAFNIEVELNVLRSKFSVIGIQVQVRFKKPLFKTWRLGCFEWHTDSPGVWFSEQRSGMSVLFYIALLLILNVLRSKFSVRGIPVQVRLKKPLFITWSLDLVFKISTQIITKYGFDSALQLSWNCNLWEE